MKRHSAHLAAALLALVPCVAVAQIPVANASNDPTPALKTQLRNLVTAQEAYWAQHGTYTTDVSALGLFKPRGGGLADSAWVQVVQAGGRSWWGRASHRSLRGKSCVIYVGLLADFTGPPATDAANLPAKREGEPICDPL